VKNLSAIFLPDDIKDIYLQDCGIKRTTMRIPRKPAESPVTTDPMRGRGGDGSTKPAKLRKSNRPQELAAVNDASGERSAVACQGNQGAA
jgi:hypothetical protein